MSDATDVSDGAGRRVVRPVSKAGLSIMNQHHYFMASTLTTGWLVQRFRASAIATYVDWDNVYWPLYKPSQPSKGKALLYLCRLNGLTGAVLSV